MEQVTELIFADPKDIEDRKIAVQKGDAIADLPYHQNASLWFDNHDKAEDATTLLQRARGKRGKAPSTAHLVYEYYNSPRLKRFEELLKENDRIGNANLSVKEVLKPEGWLLLSHTLDPLRKLDNFYDYAVFIISAIIQDPTIDQILDTADVKKNVDKYLEDAKIYKDRFRLLTRVDGNIIITDLREAELLSIGNRYIAFALFPDQNVQLRLSIIKDGSKVQISMGKSMFNKTCKIHLGHLASEYGGGGLEGAAGCSFDPDIANMHIKEIVDRLKRSI